MSKITKEEVEHVARLARLALSEEEKVRYTLNQPGPIICDVELISTETLFPKVTAVPQQDGSMISLPLEDMAPLLSRDELRENMVVPLDPASEKITV